MIDFLQANPYELPGNVRLQFTPTTGNYVRVWLLDAPTASKLKGEIAKDTQNNRVQAFEGGTADTWEVELDKGGAYVFVLQEYQQGSADFTGGYDGDPRGGFTAETKVGDEVERTVYIGERLSMQLGTGSHGFANLVLYVWDATIRQTTVALHGETTPAILHTSAATTDRLATRRRAETAALDATVQASIAALIDLPVANLVPNAETLVAEMVDKTVKHMTNEPQNYHAAGDGVNSVEVSNLPKTGLSTPEAFARAARVLSNRLRAHMENESDGGAEYHGEPDFANVIIASPPPPGSSRMPEVWASIADVHRAYEAHRLSGVHALADTDNNIETSLDPLLVVHRDFLLAMQPLSPAPPATTNPGVTAAAQLGFELEPLPATR
jgi:hypothetical protein